MFETKPPWIVQRPKNSRECFPEWEQPAERKLFPLPARTGTGATISSTDVHLSCSSGGSSPEPRSQSFVVTIMALNTTYTNCCLLRLSPACTVNRLTFPPLSVTPWSLIHESFYKEDIQH